jgi:hypothetical protein
MALQHVNRARQLITASLVAAVAANPFDPGLSEDELRGLVIGVDGVGDGAFTDALDSRGPAGRDEQRRLLASSSDMFGGVGLDAMVVPEEIRPAEALSALARAFDSIENELRTGAAVDASVIRARCAPVPPDTVDRALGFALALGSISRNGEQVARRRSWPTYDNTRVRHSVQVASIGELARSLLPSVRDVFAKRVGAHAPTEDSLARFNRFLLVQRWTGLAEWWSQTAREMNALITASHPSAICVLCGALLEAALVAVARPGQAAKEWNQNFLKNDPPERWKLSQLIDQAHAAKVLSDTQVPIALQLAETRNRIHAGKFAAGDTFKPPYTNAHEARLARENLKLLLGAVLDWEVVRKLMAPPPASP